MLASSWQLLRTSRALQYVSTHAINVARRIGKTRPIVRYLISTLLALALLGGVAFVTTASYINVLDNGDFEHGFSHQPGCGIVGNGWHCFTNGGAANYGFYDEVWDRVIASGAHGQLIKIDAKGIGAPDADRFAGIYQTVPVVDWTEYQLYLKGMIRTTSLSGDPWRYRVQVGFTQGIHADWTRVDNWADVGWDTYFERTSPGGLSDYGTTVMAKDDYMTVYIRVWKKWGIPEEELDINFDYISLSGRAPWHRLPGYTPTTQTTAPAPYNPAPSNPAPSNAGTGGPVTVIHPAPASGGAVCTGPDLIYNGTFEYGFNRVAIGHIGKGWGAFTNGGAANYGFYDEMWNRVVVDGAHGQLIEINNKNLNPADPNRYAGIYQRVTGLHAGATYELTVNGLLRGANEDVDEYRYEALWGYTAHNDINWQNVNNWAGMNLGPIYDRVDPGPMATYRVRFTAPAASMVLFITGLKKWGVLNSEMDLNFDAISLRSCHAPAPTQPPTVPYTPPASSCVYAVAPGDTLGKIAAHYGVTVNDIAFANGIANANWIYVGQKLHIPGCSGQAPAYPKPQQPAVMPERRIHVVRAGETFSGICAQYGVDPYVLADANNIANWNLIYIGQKLVIP